MGMYDEYLINNSREFISITNISQNIYRPPLLPYGALFVFSLFLALGSFLDNF